MSEREGLAERRLRPDLFESRLGLVLALLITAFFVVAVGFTARAALDCAGRSIALRATSCTSQAPAPADTGVRVVFATDTGGTAAR